MLVFSSVGRAAAAASDPIGMLNCVTSCGGVKVPYPFGIGPDASCYLPGFSLICNTTGSKPWLLLDADGIIQVLRISDNAEIPLLDVQRNGDVKISVDAHGNGNSTFSRGLRRHGPYTLASYQNELILTGCNVQATVKNGNVTLASFTSLCKEDLAPQAAEDESSLTKRCSGGTGCCHTDIVTPAGYDEGEAYSISSTGTSKYDVQLRWFGWNRSADLERFPVRVFIAEKGWYDNTSISKDLLQIDHPMSKEAMAVPVTLRWEVVGHPISSVCKSNHSEHIKGTRRGSYVCRCSRGYHGNPYLTDGCKDIPLLR
ncbi:hypothetical protein CFC21_086736 [Triticum aestivum]|uniref:Wall-associated receptor kinase galacturonan-binding domain-containing protein n=3 Tax=Triticum TaxID=4564 RepID=A0A9R0YG03_TRITD|nr:hypothetical protein CFC21_086736 [Triticum aestivum]VAI54168.1 unnamed protein product [Triticum turgidum subsp. durum]